MEEKNKGGAITEEETKDKNTDEISFEERKESLIEKDKKIKNLISLVILLAGLFFGSLFVDVSQLVRGSGFSQKNLNKSDVFEADGKTWVAFSEPAVAVSVISDDNCEECDPSEAIVWLRRVLPTVSTEKVDFDSARGEELTSQFGIKTLPAFVFGKNVENTELYFQAQELFELKDDTYVLNTKALGIPVGKYLSLPEVKEGDAVFGNGDSKVKVIVFSDFQCPYSKVFYSPFRDVMREYEDKVQFVFKDLPLSIHTKANEAALAGECALEQGKFWEYADTLFAKQAEWGVAKDASSLKNYARTLGLDAGKFNECMDDKKYQGKIEDDKSMANEFGISGTPTIFINDEVESGAITAEDLKKVIEKKLAE